MTNIKSGILNNRIQDYLGEEMTVDLKNHHQIIGKLAFYHLSEQMIHMIEWKEYDENQQITREGKHMVINRTAWFQIFK